MMKEFEQELVKKVKELEEEREKELLTKQAQFPNVYGPGSYPQKEPPNFQELEVQKLEEKAKATAFDNMDFIVIDYDEHEYHYFVTAKELKEFLEKHISKEPFDEDGFDRFEIIFGSIITPKFKIEIDEDSLTLLG